MILLVGDIGATHSRLSLYQAEPGRLLSFERRTFDSQKSPSLNEILRRFLASHPERVDYACFGIPGPVTEGRSVTTNLPWVVDAAVIERELGIRRAWLLNDLEAIAHGIPLLGQKDLRPLIEPGGPHRGNAAVIAPGSGLGEAVLYWDGEKYRPFGSEGGHCGFSPTGELQIRLLEYLSGMFSNVSWERLLSGPGLIHLYSFLRDRGHEDEPEWLRARISRDPDPAAAISREAIRGTSPLCLRTVELFVDLLGSEAANLALKTLAVGGIYVAGGIVPKLLPMLDRERLKAAFVNKGRLSKILETVPIRLVVSDEAGMLGAAHHALDQASALARPAQ